MIYGDMRELNPKYRMHSEPNETEINLKIKVDSTEIDSLIATIKELRLELSKMNDALTAVYKQCERDQLSTALHVDVVKFH